MGEEVAEDVVDVVRLLTGLVDAGRVEIDTDDLRHGPPQFAGEHALAAADIQSAPRAIGDGVEDAGMASRRRPSTGSTGSIP